MGRGKYVLLKYVSIRYVKQFVVIIFWNSVESPEIFQKTAWCTRRLTSTPCFIIREIVFFSPVLSHPVLFLFLTQLSKATVLQEKITQLRKQNRDGKNHLKWERSNVSFFLSFPIVFSGCAHFENKKKHRIFYVWCSIKWATKDTR